MAERDGTHYIDDDCPGGHRELTSWVPVATPIPVDMLSPPDHCPDAEDREDQE